MDDSNLAIPSLMPIGSPRADGNFSAPLMRTDFKVPGLMEIQTPRSDEDAIRSVAYLDMETDIITYGETYALNVELKDPDGEPIVMDDTYAVACRVATEIGGEAVYEPVMTIAGGVATGSIDTNLPEFSPGTYYFDIRITFPNGDDDWSTPTRLILEDRVTPPS